MKTETLILSVGKCSWGKCIACGWGRLEGKYTEQEARKIIERKPLDGVERLKIFASGSFLDDKQFTRQFRQWFAEYVKQKGVKELVIESRPEYITPENLSDFDGVTLLVAIGLESANDEVLKKYQKGFTVADYLKAVETLHAHGDRVRAYVMVNIPFGAREDFDKTMELAIETADEVVAINTFPHSRAPLIELWIRGDWTPLTTKEFYEWTKKWEDNPKVETDPSNYQFVPKFPPEKRELIEGATSQSLNHPYFNLWQDYLQRMYEPSKKREILLFLPCSYRKPYTRSQTHQKIFKALKRTGNLNKIDRVVVSTPGVVPMQFADHYPFNAYDWPEWDETPEIKEEYTRVTKDRVKKFLEAHAKHYKKIYCYFKHDAETYQAIQQASQELGLEIPNLLDDETWEKVKDLKNPVAKKQALEVLTQKL